MVGLRHIRSYVTAGLVAVGLVSLMVPVAEAGDIVISVHTDQEIYYPGDNILVTVMGENSSEKNTLVALPLDLEMFFSAEENLLGVFMPMEPTSRLAILKTPVEIKPGGQKVIRTLYSPWALQTPGRYNVLVKGKVTLKDSKGRSKTFNVEASDHFVVRN